MDSNVPTPGLTLGGQTLMWTFSRRSQSPIYIEESQLVESRWNPSREVKPWMTLALE